MEYKIRKIRREDVPSLNHVVTVAWNETYKGIVPDEFLEKLKNNEKERTENGLSKFREDDTTLVLEIDNEVVGFSYYTEANQDEFPGCGEIHALYIIGKYKGYGFGRKLVEESIKELKKMGFNKMIISCLRDNIPANEFYKHIGGEHIKDGVFERLNLPDKTYIYKI